MTGGGQKITDDRKGEEVEMDMPSRKLILCRWEGEGGAAVRNEIAE